MFDEPYQFATLSTFLYI